MTETGSTIEVAKAEVEKVKKEAKQQKGLLVVAKKQLATREAEKAKISQELQDAVAEAQETTREREAAEAELIKEPSGFNTSNGLPFAPSPSLSGHSVTSPPQPLSGSPGSPSSVATKSNNPFEQQLVAGGSGSLLPPFHPSSVPTPATVTPAQNEGTTTDNPFTFDQAFGDEEARPGPDVEEPSSGPERNVQPSTGKIAVNEEVSDPPSDHDLFITPPTSALDSLGANAIISTAEPEVLKLPPRGTTSPVPSTDRPREAHTDINFPVEEVAANESDSSDEDGEDKTPLAILVGRSAPSEVAKGPVSNGHALPQPPMEAAFPPAAAFGSGAEVQSQSTNPFPPIPAKDNSVFPASTPLFAASPPEPPKVATLSDFDKAFGDFPGTTPSAAGSLSFDNAFDDQFDFNKADRSTSLPAINVSPSVSSAFPPAPTSTGIVKPSLSPVRDSGFENAFRPQQKAASSARPVSSAVVDGLPILPPVPESQPLFGNGFSGVSSPAPVTTAAPILTTPSHPPVPDAPNLSIDDNFGVNGAQTDSGLGTTSSHASSIPLTQSPVSTIPTRTSFRGSTSSPETVSFPVSSLQPETPVQSPPRVASPKIPQGRPSTGGSGKEPGRHSKLSVSGHLPLLEVEKMTLVPILDPSTLWWR